MAKPRKPKIEDSTITHKKCVFGDPEFINQAHSISSDLGINDENPVERVKLGDKFYLVVGKNAELVVSKAETTKLEKLAAEFAVDIADVLDYLNNNHKSIIYMYTKPRVKAKYWPPDGITVNVPPDATRDDYINEWATIKTLRKAFNQELKPMKRKSPNDYDLVYAVFRAKSKNLGTTEIFKQYKEGILPNYPRKGTTFDQPYELERYYQRYKPETES